MSARYNFEVGHWLRTLRESMPGSGKGGLMTQVEAAQLVRRRTREILGEEVAITPQELSRLEKGQVEYPAAETLCALALGYRIEVMDILGRFHYYPVGHQEELDSRIIEVGRQLRELSESTRERVLATLEMLLLAGSQIDRRVTAEPVSPDGHTPKGERVVEEVPKRPHRRRVSNG